MHRSDKVRITFGIILTIVLATVAQFDLPRFLGARQPSPASTEHDSPGKNVATVQTAGSGTSPSGNPGVPGPMTLDSNERAFLLRQYDSAVKEIQFRLAQEIQLFVLRFSLVGGILALLLSNFLSQVFSSRRDGGAATDQRDLQFLFSNSVPACCFCWAAVVTSALLDDRDNHNQDFLITLGKWIRTHAEPALLGGGQHVKGWEDLLHSSEIMSKPAYAILRLNTKLLTLVLFGTTVVGYSLLRENPIEAGRIRLVCRLGVLVSFLLFGLHSYHFCYDLPCGWHVVPVMLAVSGIIISWRVVWSVDQGHDPGI
jgi:hypothetical protein